MYIYKFIIGSNYPVILEDNFSPGLEVWLGQFYCQHGISSRELELKFSIP
jgi:hypothetical protein